MYECAYKVKTFTHVWFMGQVCDKTTKAGKTASVHLHTHTHAHRQARKQRQAERQARRWVCDIGSEEQAEWGREKIGGGRLENQSKSCKIKPSEYSLKIMQSQVDGGGGGMWQKDARKATTWAPRRTKVCNRKALYTTITAKITKGFLFPTLHAAYKP